MLLLCEDWETWNVNGMVEHALDLIMLMTPISMGTVNGSIKDLRTVRMVIAQLNKLGVVVFKAPFPCAVGVCQPLPMQSTKNSLVSLPHLCDQESLPDDNELKQVLATSRSIVAVTGGLAAIHEDAKDHMIHVLSLSR